MTKLSDFIIKTYSQSEVPSNLKESLAILMKAQHMENSDMPPHILNYYLKPLNQPEDDEIGLIYALASEKSKDRMELIGYARFEYRKKSVYNQNEGNIRLFVTKDRRNKGCELLLINAIREIMPEYIKIVTMHAEKGSNYAQTLERLLDIEKAFESRHYYSLIRELNVENMLDMEKEVNEVLERQSLQIIYTNSDTFGQYEKEYAQLLEVIWNVGKEESEYELFPVERLRGRIQYLREEFNIFLHAFLVREKSNGFLVAIAENVLYESNIHIADEAIIGALAEYDTEQIRHVLRIKSLLLLLQETEVTHWESASLDLDENQQITPYDKILGFRIGKTFNRYKIPIKHFMNQ